MNGFRHALLLALAVSLAACGGGPRMGPVGHGGPAGPRGFADPGAVVAAEVGLARTAREAGWKDAVKRYAANGAVIFAPGRMDARDYRAEPGALPFAEDRSPHGVWMSCDGAEAVVRGVWRRGDARGYYITVWQRREDGAYGWAFIRDAMRGDPPAVPEMVQARVAKCRKGMRQHAPAASDAPGAARAKETTLRWRWEDAAGGGALFVAEIWNGEDYEQVLAEPFPSLGG